ncbi:MAG TPA: hypothetical protein VFF64_17740 [Candidatus Eremiobacteraceae bacterium]|nr:hypothetical protein [Candidatus Eremiobacteraceae bacterium]
MRARKTVLTVLTLFVGLTMCAAQNPHLGTWKLNEAKSKITPGTQKNLTVAYEAAGDNIKATLDGVDAQGKPTHNEWTGKFDGKDYPVTGDPTSDMRSYKRIDDRTLEATAKKDGKVTLTAQIVISADGKTRKLTTHSTDSSGKKVVNTAVYDKQ